MLTSDTSGWPGLPLRIEAQRGTTAVITGAKEFEARRYRDETIGPPGMMPPVASSSAFVLPLSEDLLSIAQAEHPRGSTFSPSASGLQIYQGDMRLRPARWPKTGFAIPKRVYDRGNGNGGPVFAPPAGKIENWLGEKHLWAGGFWGYDWHWETAQAVASDEPTKSLNLGPLHGPYPMSTSARYFVYNALAELDQPGTFYIDLENRLAAYLAWQGINRPESVEIPLLSTLVNANGAHDIIFERIAFEKSLGDAVVINDSHDIVFDDCFVGLTGSRGLVVRGGRAITFEQSIIAHTGETGAELSGGNKDQLIASGHRISRSIIASYGEDTRTYRPAVLMDGVGQIVERSLLTQGPHSAIIFSGNEHRIVGNEFSHVVTDSLDSGAIYGGRDWSSRGTHILGNLFRDIRAFSKDRPSDVHAIYLDDCFSGTTIKKNVFVDLDQGIFVNGGRDVQVDGNLFVHNRLAAVRIQNLSGSDFAAETLQGGTLMQRLLKSSYRSYLWQRKYPHLSSILSDDPMTPKYNWIANNLFATTIQIQYDRNADRYAEVTENEAIENSKLGANIRAQEIVDSTGIMDRATLTMNKVRIKNEVKDARKALSFSSRITEFLEKSD
jgi:hypothetical protein